MYSDDISVYILKYDVIAAYKELLTIGGEKVSSMDVLDYLRTNRFYKENTLCITRVSSKKCFYISLKTRHTKYKTILAFDDVPLME